MKRNKKNNGRKYPCDQCDYKATQKCNLLTHLKSKHEQLFPIINNWNEKNSLELKQSFERAYSIEKGVFEMANFPSNNWTEENSQELKKSFERAYRLKIHKTLTLNYSPLPSGPGLVRVSGQKRQQGRGRGEVEIEHKRENKRRASSQEHLPEKKLKTCKNEDGEELQRKKPHKKGVGSYETKIEKPKSRGRRTRTPLRDTRSPSSRKIDDRRSRRKTRRG